MSVFHWPSILASLTRTYPFFSGCAALANHRLMEILSPGSSEECWARSPGRALRVSLNDYVGRSVFFFGDLDPKITWFLKRLLKPGDRVLDIGANIGLVTLWMSKLVGPQGTVHSFEPNPVLCHMLQATLAHNGITNVKLHSIALGASGGQMELHVPIGNFGAASLIRRTGQTAQVHTVPVMKLDEIILQESEESGIAFIKLDVEGFEYEVLKGARRVLQELRPDAILFETNDKDNLSPVMQLLHDCGYDFLMIPRCLIWMRTKVVDLQHPEAILSHDLIAAPMGEPFARMRRRLRAA